MAQPDRTNRKQRRPASEHLSIASGASHQTTWPRLGEEGFGVLNRQIAVNRPLLMDPETASIASGASHQTIWPHLGQNTFSVHPSMANNPSRTSPENIDWNQVPQILISKKRKNAALPLIPSVGGSESSVLPPRSSSVYSRSTSSRDSPVSPIRGQSHVEDSFTRPPRTYYGNRKAPPSPIKSGNSISPIIENDDQGQSAYSAGTYQPPTRAAPSRQPPAITNKRKTPAPSISGLSTYLGIIYGDDDIGEIRQTKSRWPHRLTPDNMRAHAVDDFAQYFAQMTVVDSDIRSVIQQNNEELQNGEKSVVDPTWGNKHLMDRPPELPGSIHSSPAKSPNSKLTKEMASDVANKRFQHLLNVNAEFQKLMNDLTGIGEWWFENNRQWDSKKKDVESKLELIAAFKEQQADLSQVRPRKRTTKTFVSSYDERIARTDTVDEQDEYESFQEQIDLAEHDILLIKSWFMENRMLMKEVWKQFKTLQGSVEKLQETPENKSVSEPMLEFGWIWTDNYASDPQIKKHGLVWWFTQARDHLKEFEVFLNDRRRYWKNRMEKCKALEKEYRQRAVDNLATYETTEDQYDCVIQDFRNILIEEPNREAEVDEQIQKVLDKRSKQRKRFEEQERLLNKVLFSFVVEDNANRFRSNDFKDRHWRIQQVIILVKGTLAAFGTFKYPVNSPDPKTTSSIMKIAYCEAQRQEYTSILDSLLADEDVLGNPYSTKAILHQAKAHFIGQGFLEKALPLLNATSGSEQRSSHKAFNELVKLWQLEYTNYSVLVKALQKASKVKGFGQNNVDIKDAWKPTPLPPAQVYLPFQLRYSTMPLQDAVDILNRRRTSKSHRMGLKMFRFFNSPDIFPFFWGYTKASWTRAEFGKLLNSLVKSGFPQDAIDAFLTYCNHTGEMFRISGLRSLIRVSPFGWSRAPESRRFLSFERKLTHQPPHGVGKIEELMIANSDKFGIDSNERKWRKADILRVINEVNPHEKLDLKTLDKYSNYWEGSGRMFVAFHGTKRETAPYDSSASSILLRVDNGWQIPSTNPFIAPETIPHSHQRIAHKIESQIDIAPVCLQYEDRDNVIYTTEDKLYNLAYGVRTEEYSGECSRHAFHMYLRWCDKEARVFRIHRDGEVEVMGVMASGLREVNLVRKGLDEEKLRTAGKVKGPRGGLIAKPFTLGLSRITNWTGGRKR